MENKIDSKTLAIEIAKILDKKKAQDVRVLKVESLTVLTDYFVIASGTSTTQVGALADEVEYELSQKGIEPYTTDKRYKEQDCDLFLLDINLPDGSGIKFCRFIRETVGAPIIFLTANDTEEDMLLGFSEGCDDYIAKPFSLEVLRKKINAMLKRTGAEDKNIIRYKELEIDKDRASVNIGGQPVHLTATEYRLLEYLAENKGKAVSRNTLIRDIWDIDENFIDENTLSVNIRRLRKKLGDDPKNPQYIITLFGLGYTFGER